jgi:60S ribosomal protein uL30
MSTKAATPAAKPTQQKLPPVPETVLKRRKRTEAKAAEAQKKIAADKKSRVLKRRAIFKKAETYVREYRNQEKDLIRLKRIAKANGNFYVPPEAKVALVIRIRGINQLAPKPKKILQLLRLRQINNAVLIKLTSATIQMLRLVEPYIAYGYPNLKTIKDLIYKRGFAKVNGSRIPITDNSIVEKSLGSAGLVCVEDLVHELVNVGPNFKKVTNFLWPFKLSPPSGGFVKVTRAYTNGGDYGNREDRINALVRKMI